jgi:hypothetical protein
MASSISAGTTSSTALVATADTTGALVLQTNNGTTALTLSTAQNATFAGTLTTASRGIAAASMPAGSVLQVVQGSYSSPFSTTSSSYVSTGASATITPTSSTSKILAQVSVNIGNQVYNWLYLTLYRGSTNISTVGSTNPAGWIMTNSVDYLTTSNFQILDSPATTSATTYTLYIKGQGNTVRAQVDSMPTYITLIEVAA